MKNKKTPFTLGWDVVGVVDKLGDNISTWQTGLMETKTESTAKANHSSYLYL